MVEKKDTTSQNLDEAMNFNPNEHREMTIHDYYTNPYGKGSTFVNVTKIKEDLELRYDKMLAKSKKGFHVKVYRRGRKENAEYFILVHMPSETLEGLYYDVVIQLTPWKGTDHAKTINNYHIKFFSNSASFVFTFAYTYNIHNLLVKECINKLDKETLRKSPTIRNQYNMVGFEKTLFYACHYIMNNLSELSTLNEVAIELNERKMLENISTSDEKLAEYRTLKRIAKENGEEAEKSKSPSITRKQTDKKKARTERTDKKAKTTKTSGRSKTSSSKAKIKGKRKLK